MNDLPIEPVPFHSTEVDLIETCERAAGLRCALDAATTAAAFDDTLEMNGAAEVIRPFASPGCIDADDAAAAAHRCVPMALRLSLASWNSEMARLCLPTARLWRRFAAEGWTEPFFSGRATACLARRMIDPDGVARVVAEGLDDSRPVVLLGFGENGRRLAELLTARGTIVSARDDSISTPGVVEVGGALVPVWPGYTPMHAEAQYVSTRADDVELVAGLPVCLDLVRWSEAREALYARTATKLLLSWPISSRARREAA